MQRESDKEAGNRLPPGQKLSAPDRWAIVGEKAPRRSDAPWTISVAGLVAEPQTWSLAELWEMPRVVQIVDIHCVTTWSKLGARFEGVMLAHLLERCRALPEARYVSYVARSERNHSTSLPLSDALELQTLIALTYEGKPLEEIHGGPVRIVTPGRYFYKSLKWLERIDLQAEDRLGYWEAEAGYHNVADPWREQRYIASRLDRKMVQALLERRDLTSHTELLSLDASGRDLAGLNARGVAMRNASFVHCNLENACFDGANLSNAHLEGANLRHASFIAADAEGANFRGADLRNADFTGALLTAATFCQEKMSETSVTPEPEMDSYGPALIDSTTRFPEAALAVLTPIQQQFVKSRLG